MKIFPYLFVTAFLLTVLTAGISAQSKMDISLHQAYTEAGISLRIDNSGVYGLRGITGLADGFALQTELKVLQYSVREENRAHPVSPGNMPKILKTIDQSVPLSSSSFVGGTETSLTMENGSLKADDGTNGSIAVKGRERLVLDVTSAGRSVHYEEEYPGNLAFGDVIGIDAQGYIFVEVQLYLKEVPLQVQRQVLVLSPAGERCSRLVLPVLSYCTTERDLQIDATGRLYYLMTEETSFSIACWSGLTEGRDMVVSFPAGYERRIHFNDLAKTPEPKNPVQSLGKTMASSRITALSIAESYILHRYTCSAANLSPADVTGPDNDVVRTPSWLVIGRNSHIPYKWGGFSTVAQFDAGLAIGRYAGDINTAGVSGYAVGVDCSGYVSRCWQLSSHYSTSMMPSITTTLANWDLLKPGDGILKSGHVRLFVGKSINGYLRVAESSGRDWGVSYWSYTPDQLSVYSPVSLNQMEGQYSMQQPEMLSAVNTSGKHSLVWKCDTTNVTGYRLYRSTDGTSWSLLLNENSLKTQTISITATGTAVSYRVSSVLNTAGAPESMLSNAVCVGVGTASGTILIVDGFSRQIGGWRGAGHTFAARYGISIASEGASIETAKRSLLDDQTISLQPYKGVIWIAGDQSTKEDTVLYKAERDALKQYLEAGENLFISGSEIGYALSGYGNTETRGFYNDYLKASYLSDDAGTTTAEGTTNSLFHNYQKISFDQTYVSDYPDEIGVSGGGSLCMSYGNGKGAGVCYSGTFGSSSIPGKVVYIGFPLETIADESVFSGLLASSLNYFFNTTNVEETGKEVPVNFNLSQNYPNPFNPTTVISYELPVTSYVDLRIFDVLGREVAILVIGEKPAGRHFVQWDAARFASGMYLYRLHTGSFVETKKLLLMK